MSEVFLAALRSWSIPPAATFAIALTIIVYLRGWWLLRRAGSRTIPPWRVAFFLAGMFTLWVALASPMDVFNGFLLTAHMLQHMLLMMVVPPLLLLGSPLVPMLRGLPIFAAREFGGPFLNWPIAQRVGLALTHPALALLLMGVTMFAWHVPRLYELALASSAWHEVEHASFLAVSIIFWWPVIEPWPSRPRWSRWLKVPYLLIADLQNTVLSAILLFSDRVLYPSYASEPRLFGMSALEDQVAAGAMMWVVGSLAFVIPVALIAVQYLSSRPVLANSRLMAESQISRIDLFDAVHSQISMFGAWLQGQCGTKTVEGMSFALLFIGTGLCLVSLANSADHEEQALHLQSKSGEFAVAVYGPNEGLTVGETKFGILVQDSTTDSVVLNSAVQVSAQAVETREFTGIADAAHQDSTNKLMQAAVIRLPAAGAWTLHLDVQRAAKSAEFSFPILVSESSHEHGYPWSSIVFIGCGLGLLLTYALRHRSTRASDDSSWGGSGLAAKTSVKQQP